MEVMNKLTIYLASLLLLTAATACAPTGGARQAALEDSTQIVAFAMEAPQRNQRLLTELEQGEAALQEATTAMAGWPQEDVGLSGEPLASLYQDAARDGRSQAVVEVMRRNLEVRGFLERHQESLNRRVQGGVAARLKKDGCLCEVNTYGTVNYALREESQRRLEEDMRAYSRAHQRLQEQDLRRRDDSRLEERLDLLLRQSFFVHVRAPALHQEIERAEQDLDDLQSTLEAQSKRLQQEIESGESKRAQQKQLQQDLELLQERRQSLQSQQETLQSLRKQAQEKQQALEEQWRKALDTLVDDTEAQK